MHFVNAFTLGLTLFSGPTVLAHPGHDVNKEIAARREFLSSVKRTNLAHCSEKLKTRGVEGRNIVRRQAKLEEARAKSITYLASIHSLHVC